MSRRTHPQSFETLEPRVLLAGHPAVGAGPDDGPAISQIVVTPTELDEGAEVALSGDLASALAAPATIVIDWGDGSGPTSIDLDAGATTFATVHTYLDDDPTGTPVDTCTVSALIDGADPTTAVTAPVIVHNVAPAIQSFVSSAPGVGDGREGEPVTVTGAFTDVGLLDTHTAVINWGDGTTSAAVVTEAAGAGTFAAEHVYATGGIYQLSVTLADDDTGSASGSAMAVISGVGVHDGVLQVIGTDANDNVHLNQQGNGRVKVHARFIADRGHWRAVDLAGVQRIEILLGDGNDRAQMAGNIATPTLMDGGAGNDRLNAGRGPAVLVGAEGNDMLLGGPGPMVLIGGTGMDKLNGGPGDSILIGGRTAFDINDDAITADYGAALRAISAEWASGAPIEQRIANLEGTGTDGLNGDSLLVAGTTVLDTTPADKLMGGSGQNWFFGQQTGRKRGHGGKDFLASLDGAASVEIIPTHGKGHGK